MLDVAGLDVNIGGVPIIRGATLKIASRRITCLIGRNGAGKTTTLRAIMGLLPPAGGSLLLERGPDLAGAPAHERPRLGIGYMPEERRLIGSMTVEDNILLPHWALGLPDWHERLAQVYELIPECLELRSRQASLLSGGQQKLVALARALLVGRRLLLLDEPTEGLAPALVTRMVEILRRFADTQITVLIAESSPERIGAFADYIYTIDRGIVTSS